MSRSPEQRLRRQPTPKVDAALLAQWEERLKQSDPSLMTPDEEVRGVHFGAPGAEDVIFEESPENKLITQIAEAIAREPGNELYSVPGSMSELKRVVLQLVNDCKNQKYGEPKVGVHHSCVSGDPCVVIALPDKHPRNGVTFHLPTVNIEQFSIADFCQSIERLTKLDVRVKP